jgi:catechol 2,3-dioxygenase-like lactoylglutathione lyase family enzyme
VSSPTGDVARVRRVIVSVKDTEVALAFYRDLLNLDVVRQAGDFTSLRSGDGLEILLHRRDIPRGGPAVALGFVVGELRSTVRAWSAHGGEVIDEPARQPWGEEMAVVRDADGHVVCLSQA